MLAVPFAGADQTLVGGVNDLGQIVGSYHDGSGFHGFVLKQGTFTALNVPFAGETETQAYGINLLGEIVGHYEAPQTLGFVMKDSVFTTLEVPFAGTTATSLAASRSKAKLLAATSTATAPTDLFFVEACSPQLNLKTAAIRWLEQRSS
jgi:hypothetical protein